MQQQAKPTNMPLFATRRSTRSKRCAKSTSSQALFIALKEHNPIHTQHVTLSGGAFAQTGGRRALAALCLGHLLGLLSGDDLDVGGRAHVGVDAAVGTVGAAASGTGSVDLKGEKGRGLA